MVQTWQRCLRWNVHTSLPLAVAEVINDVLECPEQHYSDVRLVKTLAAAAVSICCAVFARADFRAKRIGSPLRACLLGVLVILPLAMLNIAAKRVCCAVRVPVAQQSRQRRSHGAHSIDSCPGGDP